MSWRTVMITGRAKLDLCMNYMEVRGESTRKVHLNELETLIIESTAVSVTAGLLCELMHRNVKVIFCDERHNPQSELLSYRGHHESSERVRQQARWDMGTKAIVWSEIVSEKIRRQQAMLEYAGEQERAALLAQYARRVRPGDEDNREGHAAKVYFNGLFGLDFTRGDPSAINEALNYGYSVLLSSVNRAIVADGYITQIGIFHDNLANAFNLGCDLMEIFRPLVDRIVWEAKPKEMDRDMRTRLVQVLNQQVRINNTLQYVSAAIEIFCHSAIEAMNQKSIDELSFYIPDYPDRTESALLKKVEAIGSSPECGDPEA